MEIIIIIFLGIIIVTQIIQTIALLFFIYNQLTHRKIEEQMVRDGSRIAIKILMNYIKPLQQK